MKKVFFRTCKFCNRDFISRFEKAFFCSVDCSKAQSKKIKENIRKVEIMRIEKKAGQINLFRSDQTNNQL